MLLRMRHTNLLAAALVAAITTGCSTNDSESGGTKKTDASDGGGVKKVDAPDADAVAG